MLAACAAVLWLGTIAGRRLPALADVRPLVVWCCVLCMVWRPRLTTGVVCLAACGLAGGASAWHGVVVDAPRQCDGLALVRSDPRVTHGATSVVLEIDDLRWRVTARGRVGGVLARSLAGETVRVSATCSAGDGVWAERDRVRHIVGRAVVTDVSETTGAGGGLSRASNRVRRALVDGARFLPDGLSGLFTGLVVGDDRAQPEKMVDDFRAAGISHLTAVSGQNVAFLIAMMSPLLNRMGRWGRLTAVLSLIAWFTVLTRAEPSVVRAGVMAGLVAISGAMGAGLNARSVLSLTVSVLLMVDPMLAWSVGFALSVGATGGLAWLSAPIADVLGWRVARSGVVSSTLAAQAGTAPVLLAVFGSIPVVTLLANPLVIGVAGVVMTIGVPLALAGAFFPWLAPFVALVLAPMLWWIARVASLAAAVGPSGWVNVVLWIGVVWWFTSRWRTARRRLPCGKVDAWPHG